MKQPFRHCPRHHIMLWKGQPCPLCDKEQRTGEPVDGIRGERLEDHDGKLIEVVRDA